MTEIDDYYNKKKFECFCSDSDYKKAAALIPEADSDKLVLDADNLLMIMNYILLQCPLVTPKLYSEINFIYEFSTDA